jgi:hypothetical protein
MNLIRSYIHPMMVMEKAATRQNQAAYHDIAVASIVPSFMIGHSQVHVFTP